MARPGHAYPQVEYRATDLIDVGGCPGSPDTTAAEALALLRARGAGVLLLPRAREAVMLADVERAVALGLGDVAAGELSRSVPAVDAGAREPMVRRRLRHGAPAVLVRDDGVAVGAVTRRGSAADLVLGPSIATALERWLAPDTLALLREIGEMAQALESRAFLVGGVVRDALLQATLPGAPARDIDVVVEGDGAGVARRLAQARGGRVLSHQAFGTAAIQLDPPGTRVDVATARRERYAAPGALPDVQFSTIGDDLARRDFTVNAMAAELTSGTFALLDPFGGREDLARRRLRVLHPLSFVEDPTRILRAARYAARLGLRLEAATRRARRLAVSLAPYPALSPARIAAEMGRLLADEAPSASLRELAESGAFRLLEGRWRIARDVRRALDALDAALAWNERHALGVRPLAVAALAVVAGVPEAIAEAALANLGFAGEPLADLVSTRAGAAAFRRELGELAGAPPSRRAAALRHRRHIELVFAWLEGDERVRGILDAFVAHESRVRPDLGGDDVIALGVPAGPAVGQVLDGLRDGRLDGRLGTRESEVAAVRAWLGASGSVEPETEA